MPAIKVITPKVDAMLRQLFAEKKLSYRQMSQATGISESSVQKFGSRNEIPYAFTSQRPGVTVAYVTEVKNKKHVEFIHSNGEPVNYGKYTPGLLCEKMWEPGRLG